MARPYYSLIARDGSPGCQWGVQFGDYDREVVVVERDDEYIGHSWPARDLKIITTPSSKQAQIDAVLAELNGETFP